VEGASESLRVQTGSQTGGSVAKTSEVSREILWQEDVTRAKHTWGTQRAVSPLSAVINTGHTSIARENHKILADKKKLYGLTVNLWR